MRCVTLADGLRRRGADCQFICREHENNLIDFIRSKNYDVHVLPLMQPVGIETKVSKFEEVESRPSHYHWLGATQQQDIEACIPKVAKQYPDWLIVDHYALDARWESALASHCVKLMAIDDLADRPHFSDLLLDQTFGRRVQDYQTLVTKECRILCGCEFALLRPEFAELRNYSIRRRTGLYFRHLLISMGGVDKDNATGRVLESLRTCSLPAEFCITIILGAKSPWIQKIRADVHDMPWPTRVLVNVQSMASIMAECDLAIGAPGTTSWERCCLGVPAILLQLAENQRDCALRLSESGAVRLISCGHSLMVELDELLNSFMQDKSQLLEMSKAAAQLVDGYGVNAVLREMGL